MTTLEGNALRRAVAEAQGYRLELRRGKDLITGEWFFNNRWVSSAAVGEDEVWRFLALEKRIPDYPNDLNTIKDVKSEYSWELFAVLTETGVTYDVIFYTPNECEASHSEPATAFWNAWLEMRKGISDERKEN